LHKTLRGMSLASRTTRTALADVCAPVNKQPAS
jgi:hypothetical protein